MSYPQPYQPGYGPAQDAQGAMPAMVLGIVSLVVLPLACCCGFGGLAPLILGILAIVFGVMARNRITASQGALGGRGKAMAGIITGAIAVGLAVILIILVLAIGLGSGSIVNYLNSFASPSPT